MLVISVIPMQKYKKASLSKVFGCTRKALYKAEKWKYSYGACGQPKEYPKTRLKMDLRKAENFVEYLLSSSAIQDVSYETCSLKLDTEEKHLWKILGAIKPSQRRCLAGLDNTIAAGSEGFETLNKIAYFSYCTQNNNCKSYCISYALSSPKDINFSLPCTTSHDNSCPQCSTLLKTERLLIAEAIDNMKSSEHKDDTKYDFIMATENIFDCLKHNIHYVQHNKAKIDAFAKLNDTTCLWIQDWAQKVLPIKYSESPKKYFDKS
ncbi:hypothetical protein JTE90_024781 [Oedothorax gibbosus]|uniref:Uncharacterized protein n=1 Tax=Oedothorax gibbosus TaxID=931172 RepID=A0AAV6U9P1_9ARAC|nr:hypothetical protein JTE90_024781 [Oedothorax gibbosus]